MATKLNFCRPLFEPADRVTGSATAAVVGKRFLNASANFASGPGLNTSVEGGNIKVAHATAGGVALAVSEYDAASGRDVGMLMQPGMLVPVTADGNIAAGAAVEVGTAGKAKTIGSGVRVGICVSGATDGADAFIKIFS